jgi:glycine/D-amino acid oxidase-like deaminating enzyme
VVYDAAQWAAAQKAVAAMRTAMPESDPAAEYTLYSREEALAQFPCSDDVDAATGAVTPICGVVRYPAGSVSAYRFTVGVLKRCLARGLNLQTNTPVLAINKNDDKNKDGRRWMVATDRGTVSARHVVLATNGYTAHLVPALQGVVVPLRGQITMHRPGSKMPPLTSGNGGGLQTTYSFIYDQGYEYMISRTPGSTCAGDIVIGGGLKFADTTEAGGAGKGGLCEYGTTDDTALNPTVSSYLRDAPVRYFGRAGWGDDHSDGAVRAEWTGIMGYTPDGYPLVGEMPSSATAEDNSGLWLCCAFQGHGMAYSWPCGQALATMIQATELEDKTTRDEEDAALLQWLPDCFRVTDARLKLRFAGRLH